LSEHAEKLMTSPACLPDIDGLLSETEISEIRTLFEERCAAAGVDVNHQHAGLIYLDLVSSFLSGLAGKSPAPSDETAIVADALH